MKKLVQFSAYLLLAGIILSSCSPITITKRHYKKGFYTDFGFKNQAKNNKTESTELKESDYMTQTAAEELPVEENASVPISASVESSASVTDSPVEDNLELITTQDKPAKIAEAPVLKSKFEAAKQVMKSTQKIKKALAKSPPSGDARSLLWIIIVIIVILWLVSLLFGGFGLGGLMNLLLLVALILLILWLLRII